MQADDQTPSKGRPFGVLLLICCLIYFGAFGLNGFLRTVGTGRFTSLTALGFIQSAILLWIGIGLWQAKDSARTMYIGLLFGNGFVFLVRYLLQVLKFFEPDTSISAFSRFLAFIVFLAVMLLIVRYLDTPKVRAFFKFSSGERIPVSRTKEEVLAVKLYGLGFALMAVANIYLASKEISTLRQEADAAFERVGKVIQATPPETKAK